MPTLMYLRKSRADLEAEARGEGDTLARHEAELRRTAARMGLTVTDIYREIVSGETIAARPQMQRLLAEVEHGVWDSVLVMEVERLARGDTIDQGIVAQAFKYSGTKIVTPIKVFDPANEFDEEYFEFGLFMSRREYKTITRRLQRGREASVREGKYCGSKAPFGYVRVKLPHEKGWTLSPDPETAPVVRDIYSWYAGPEALGTQKIADRLNMRGVLSYTGKRWTPASVRTILHNPVYAGELFWRRRGVVKRVENGVVTKTRPWSSDALYTRGLHEPLIPSDVYKAAQVRLSQTVTTTPKDRSLQNPLAGLVICGVCGRHMTRRPYKTGYPDTLMCQYKGCPTVSSLLSEVEAALLEAMRSWLALYKADLRAASAPDSKSAEAAEIQASIDRVRAELDTLRQQEKRAYDLVEQGVYTTEVFLERSREIASRRTDAELRLSGLSADLEAADKLRAAREEIIPRFEDVLTTYPLAQTPAEKNALLRSVLDHVVYTKTTRTRWAPSGSDMELQLYPLLPQIGRRD